MTMRTFSTDQGLIVAYSYTGHTLRLAQAIETVVGCVRSTLYPTQPYPMAFPELLAQVKQEIARGFLPRLLPVARSPHPYDLIFAGSPNWCGTIAPPLAAWLHRNDLSGKVILPFYSHCGGVAGDLRAAVAKYAPGADVRSALGIVAGDTVDVSKAVRDWLIENDIAIL